MSETTVTLPQSVAGAKLAMQQRQVGAEMALVQEVVPVNPFGQVTGNITDAGQAVQAGVTDAGLVVFQVSGTYAGVQLTFEASLDGSRWFAITARRSDRTTQESATGAMSANTTRAWSADVNGFVYFRVRATNHASGTAAIVIAPSPLAAWNDPFARLLDGGSLVGDVGAQYRASATGAANNFHVDSSAGVNAFSIKPSGGRLIGWSLFNVAAGKRYVKLHNTSGTPSPGAGVALTIGIPNNGGSQMALEGGIAFGAGIAITIVAGAADGDATAVGDHEVVGDLFYM